VRKCHAAICPPISRPCRRKPTIKQRLAVVRMLIDWLITGQVRPLKTPIRRPILVKSCFDQGTALYGVLTGKTA
jgi:hypothetical protein